MEMLKVSSKSNPNSVAGAIANVFRENGSAPMGVNLICIPAFQDITIGNEERTAIKIIVEAR